MLNLSVGSPVSEVRFLSVSQLNKVLIVARKIDHLLQFLNLALPITYVYSNRGNITETVTTSSGRALMFRGNDSEGRGHGKKLFPTARKTQWNFLQGEGPSAPTKLTTVSS